MTRNLLAAAAIVAVLFSQAHAQPPASETAAVQAALDELKAKAAEQSKTINTMAAALEAMESRRPADPATKSLAALGCKPNDPKFDNSPLIQPVLDAGYNIDVDGLYYTSPLKTPVGVLAADGKTLYGRSCVIAGQGAGYRHYAKGVTGFVAFHPDQACIIECPGGASPGQKQVVRDLYLLGNEKCDGIRIYAGRALSIEDCVIRDCGGRGVFLEPQKGCYSNAIRGCSILNCGIGIEVNSGASVCTFAVYSTEIIGGKHGVIMNGWRRGALFSAVVCEAQTDHKYKFTDSRAAIISGYNESDAGFAGVWCKNSKITIIDTNAGGVAQDSESQITWVGDNHQSYTRLR